MSTQPIDTWITKCPRGEWRSEQCADEETAHAVLAVHLREQHDRFSARVGTGSDEHAFVVIDTGMVERTVVFGADDLLEVEAEAEARNR
jgi:hypothetical protein